MLARGRPPLVTVPSTGTRFHVGPRWHPPAAVARANRPQPRTTRLILRTIDHLPAGSGAQSLQKGYGAVARGYQRGAIDRITEEMHRTIAEDEVCTPRVTAPVSSMPLKIRTEQRGEVCRGRQC